MNLVGGPASVLVAIVVLILWTSRRHSWEPLFRWLPIPLWCYALPLLAVTLGWLPREHPLYHELTTRLLPIALGLLLLGVDLPSVMRTGWRALMAAAVGAAAIIIGAAAGVWILQGRLPPEAWKGAGALAGTWTGGTMNLLALRSVLGIPNAVFAPILVVDPMVAYSWMALLVAASGFQQPINRWLRAPTPNSSSEGARDYLVWGRATPMIAAASPRLPPPGSHTSHWVKLVLCAGIALALALAAQWCGARLPTSRMVNSATGWAVLLVTTATLGLSLIPRTRAIGEEGIVLGYPCLYLVLATTGAQANLSALWSTPVWLLLGVFVAALHGASLLLVGRLLQIPLGVLATTSQANIGGVVSAPLVGAVYDQSLAPVGLLLAMAENALGTYFGWSSAILCRWLLRI